MIVDEATRGKLRDEAVKHCETLWQWWPGIVAKEEAALEHAGTYLDFLAADDKPMCDIVMIMLQKQTGVDWASIRDSR